MAKKGAVAAKTAVLKRRTFTREFKSKLPSLLRMLKDSSPPAP